METLTINQNHSFIHSFNQNPRGDSPLHNNVVPVDAKADNPADAKAEDTQMELDELNRKRKLVDTKDNTINTTESSNIQSLQMQSKSRRIINRKIIRNTNAEQAVLNRLHGVGLDQYDLFCFIEDADPTSCFSKQPIRVIDALLEKVLGINSIVNKKGEIFSINKFKRDKDEKFILEVRVSSEEFLSKLLNLNTIGSFSIKVSENFTKNCVKGTFRDFRDDFVDEKDEEIHKYFLKKGLKEITQVNRLGESQTFSVCFRGQTLPKKIDIGIRSYNIRKFVPKPPRCFRCQDYSHSQRTCRNDYRCFRCGISYSEKSEHTPKDCDNDLKCVHCDKKHTTGNAKCSTEILERKFQQIMSDLGISRREAKDKYPTGIIKPFAVVATRPMTFSDVPQSLTQSNNPSLVTNPLEEIVSQLVNQNKQILERLDKKDSGQVNPLDKTDKEEITDGNEDTYKTLVLNVKQMEERMNNYDKKVELLESAIAKKDQIIANQEEQIAKLTKTIEQQNGQLAIYLKAPNLSSPEQDLLEANGKLLSQNVLMEEKCKNQEEQIKGYCDQIKKLSKEKEDLTNKSTNKITKSENEDLTNQSSNTMQRSKYSKYHSHEIKKK